MRLISILCVLLASVFGIGCNDTNEEQTKKFETVLFNKSGKKLNLSMFILGELYESTEIEAQSSYICIYDQFTFRGLSACSPNVNIGSGIGSIDSLVIEFSNSKGFICNFGSDDNSLCFDEVRNPLDALGYIETTKRKYQFIVTQEDYENAHELPE